MLLLGAETHDLMFTVYNLWIYKVQLCQTFKKGPVFCSVLFWLFSFDVMDFLFRDLMACVTENYFCVMTDDRLNG